MKLIFLCEIDSILEFRERNIFRVFTADYHEICVTKAIVCLDWVLSRKRRAIT